MRNYCNELNIKFIDDLPYRPHSQGVVERLHTIIKRGLYCYKNKFKNKYNIDYSLSNVNIIKNDTYCRVIYSTSKKLFFKTYNENEIKIINDKNDKNPKGF